MKTIKRRQICKLLLLSFFTCMLLPNCGLFSSSKSKYKLSRVPKVPTKQLPGSSSDDWRYIGTSQDGQIAVEISESSISTSGTKVKFQDRKTIITPELLINSGPLGKYKYSLSWWVMDCNSKEYSITSTSIYDERGILLKNYSFSNNQPIIISKDSIAELQYNYLCFNINRQIGY